MKPALFVFLALSVAANLALALKLRAPAVPAPAATAPATTAVPVTAASDPSSAAASSATTKIAPTGATPIAGIDWTSLGIDGDLAQVVAKLRAAGFPDSVIRAIVYAELTERTSARRKALLATDKGFEYWKGRSPYQLSAESMSARRELHREIEATLKSLLGPDLRPDSTANLYQRQQYGNLSRDKVELLQQISSDYSDLTQQIRIESQGLTLLEDRQKLAYLEAEKLKDIAQVLTPQEFEDYQLRTSNSAQQLRSQLVAFEPTEQEFRALFKLQQAFDDKFNFSTGTVARTSDGMQQRQEAEKKLIADAKELLGAERGAQFERARDYTYQAAAQIARRYELPANSADNVWAVKTDIDQRATAIRTNRDLPAADRTSQLAALQQEAISKVTAALGQKGYNAYKDSGGYWMQNLNPPQAPAKK